MHALPSVLTLLIGSALSLPASEPPAILDAAALSSALRRARPGDTLRLGADVRWSGPEPLSIPSGVTLDGDGHTIRSVLASGELLRQDGVRGARARRLGLATERHAAWAVSVRRGDLRLEACEIRCRVMVWAGGSLRLEDSRCELELPAGSDHAEPLGVHGAGASLLAHRCRFRLGWAVRHVDLGLFHNFGGDPASRLEISRSTVIGAPDPSPGRADRQLAVFRSDTTGGPHWITSVTDSIIFAEAGCVFRSEGSGRVLSRRNGFAGMLRSPGVLAGGDPLRLRREPASAAGPPVDSVGDVDEPNPFVDAPGGDFRLVASARSARAASDGGPLGADPDVVARASNAYNLDFRSSTAVEHRTRGFREDLFDGWAVRRDTDQQHCRRVEDGPGASAMRLEAWRTGDATGGPATQAAFQTFVVIPGYRYTIRAFARRGALGPVGTWRANGLRAEAVIGVADGVDRDPGEWLASAVVEGPEDRWRMGEVTVTARSPHLTLHLVHRACASWSRVDWSGVTISPRCPVGVDPPAALPGPVLGYIREIPAESDAARERRHRRVAERRAGVPIIVHRGASRFDPENTLEAYARAMDRGADGVEIDPRRTADGVLYSFHDATVDRMLAGHGRGAEMTYHEIASLELRSPRGRATDRTRVPTLVSVLQLARERAMLLHIDVKESGVEDLLIGLLDRMDMWDHVVMVNPSPAADRIRFHPRARLLGYKQHTPSFDDAAAVARFLERAGEMVFVRHDPWPAARALGREAPGERPLPSGLRAWWWPDGHHRPADRPAPGEER